MKLDTSKYKLTIYSETTCPTCVELNSSLEEHSIPFEKKDITKGTATRGPSIDNRWDFLDITKEVSPDKAMLVPLIVVESVEGEKKYHSAGWDFDEVKEFMEILKQYCI
jgi:glutaredoxin